MKTVFRLFSGILIIFVLYACEQDQKPAAKISFDPEEVVFEATGELVQTVTVSANTYWQASLPAGCDWLTLPFRGAGAGDTLFELSATEYANEDAPRTVQITFETFDGSTYTLAVRQNAFVKPEPIPEDVPLDLEPIGIGEGYDWQ